MSRRIFLPILLCSSLLLIVLSGCRKTPEATPIPEPIILPTQPSASDSVSTADDSTPEVISTPTPAPLPELTFEMETTAVIPPNNEAIANENGVTVQIAPEALDEGMTAELSEWAIDPSWRQALEQAYTIDAPFVSLAAAGANDSQGRAMLRLPAPGPDSRLMVFLDNTYLVMLDVQPQDGFLETAVRLGPADSSNLEQAGSIVMDGSIQYTVLTSRTTAAVKGYFSKPALRDGRSCGAEISYYTGQVISRCRQNSAGSVKVTYQSSIDLTDSQADEIAEAIATAIGRYETLGFTAAKITASSPMYVVIKAGGEPEYSSKTGTIYLPVDAAQGMIGGAVHDTLHEMAHWIQDEEYNMAWAALSGGTWWLEMAAENMVMLHDPAYISQNLAAYGPVTSGDQLTFQLSSNQWPGDLYVQAQLVKLNMCDDTAVCPLSEQSFIEAINAGTYPYDNADAQSKLSANLDAYANYLLGTAPTSGNTAMPLEGAVVSGSGYGEFVEIRQTNKSDYDIVFPAESAQMAKSSDALGETVQIAATLQKDGVYPFRVSSGYDGRNPGLPVKLTIQPGAPFWYRVGNDAPQFNDGSQELVLQPIHLTLGQPNVRIVALGKTGGETFQATVSQIDLQGVWLVAPGEPIVDNIVCQDATVETEDGTATVHASKEMATMLPTFIGLLGDFRPDAAGNGLSWELVNGRLYGEGADDIQSAVQFSGAVLPGVDKVQAQTEMVWSQTTSQFPQRPQWASLLFGVGIVIPALWGWRRNGRRPYINLLMLFAGVVFLTGCFGFNFDLWGTATTTMEFTSLEYLGGEAVPTIRVDSESLPTEKPLWRLRGTAVYDVNFNFGDTDTTAVATCTGTATYNIETNIYKDIVFDLE